MCIIILNSKNGNRIKKETLRICNENNSEGIGIFYSDSKKITVKKTFDISEALEWYGEIKNKKINIGFHFRIGTSGVPDLRNVHPFFVNSNLVFAHNGIFDIDIPFGSKISDTQIFNNTILKKLPSDFLDKKHIVTLISGYCQSSKLLFLDSAGNAKIINEKLGIWENGNWFSNRSYLTEKQFFGKDYFNGYRCYFCNKKIYTETEIDALVCKDCLDMPF